MTGKEIKEKQENQNAGTITSFIIERITELETMEIKKELKINLFDAIINVIRGIEETLED